MKRKINTRMWKNLRIFQICVEILCYFYSNGTFQTNLVNLISKTFINQELFVNPKMEEVFISLLWTGEYHLIELNTWLCLRKENVQHITESLNPGIFLKNICALDTCSYNIKIIDMKQIITMKLMCLISPF